VIMPRRLFHLQFGTAGGTEQFFVRLTRAFHSDGATQAFAIRPAVSWRADVEEIGQVFEGHFLRRTPRWWAATKMLQRTIAKWQPDAVIAWRAPAARLIPDLPDTVKLVRLGDYPRHLKHFGRIDCIVGNTPGVVAHCKGLGWTGRSEIISNFPPPPGADVVARATLATPAHVPLACVAARFVPTKAVETALSAVAQCDGLWLWLVGDGPGRAALEAQVAELGIADRVRFAGWANDITPYIRAADVFCVPSRQEPLGNVVLEGWSCGTPVVTTATEGPSWFAQDERDCLMVPIDDPAQMARALGRIIETPALAQSIVEGGRKTLAARFSETQVVAQYKALIDALAPASRGA